MKISDFLSPAEMMLDVRAKDKASLLRQLCIEAATKLGLNADEVVGQIAKREALGSTGLGNGLALPHARLKGLNAPFALLARLHHGIDFDSIDNQPVDLVFMLLAPEGAGADHLKALARVSRLLRNQSATEKLRAAKSAEALYAILTDTTGLAGAQAA